jgi:hypothetical protein
LDQGPIAISDAKLYLLPTRRYLAFPSEEPGLPGSTFSRNNQFCLLLITASVLCRLHESCAIFYLLGMVPSSRKDGPLLEIS